MIERSFRFDEKVYDELREISKQNDMTIAQLVRLAVKRFLADYYECDDLVEVIMKD